MEHTHRWGGARLRGDSGMNARQVASHLLIVMSIRASRRVWAVVAHVEQNDVKTGKQRLPKHPVTVNCKSIAI